MKKFVLIMIALVLCFAVCVFAQEEALLDSFIGSWRGAGTLFGQQAEFVMTWERVLHGQFVRLSFRNPAIQAEAFYHLTDSPESRGTWIDSRGVILPLTAVVHDSVLETTWGSAETEQGRTTYRLLEPNAMNVTDFVFKDGQWRRFGHARYTRQNALLEKMRWLLGVWRRESDRGLTHETWRKLSDRTFEGESVRISKASGDTVFTESLRLVQMQGELFYLPKVAENAYPVPFKLVAFQGNRVVFENPEHDFPQRIIYYREDADSLTVTVEGATKDDNRRIDFHFRREK
ncbi:MAG: DUF6265 family protein [bacterium]